MTEPSRDQLVGQNLAQLRGEMSQQTLADLMRKEGFEWAQATVWSVEKGKRPIRLLEAEALAKLFRVDIGDLLRVPDTIKLQNLVNEYSAAETDLWQAAKTMETAMRAVVELADSLIAEGTSPERVDETLQYLGMAYSTMCTPAESLRLVRPIQTREAATDGPWAHKYLAAPLDPAPPTSLRNYGKR